MTDVIARNNVRVFGRGTQPMLFAHGFGCDQNMWRFLTPAFEDDDQIVLFDFVGAGRSHVDAYDPVRYGSLNGYAQDILDVCHALELSDDVVVAHSVSSMAAILAANREPDRFAHLIMVGPSPRYINEDGYLGGVDERTSTASWTRWTGTPDTLLSPAQAARPRRGDLSHLQDGHRR